MRLRDVEPLQGFRCRPAIPAPPGRNGCPGVPASAGRRGLTRHQGAHSTFVHRVALGLQIATQALAAVESSMSLTEHPRPGRPCLSRARRWSSDQATCLAAPGMTG